MTAGRALFGKRLGLVLVRGASQIYYVFTGSHFERANSTTNNYRWSPATRLSSAVSSCTINLVLYRYYPYWVIDSWLAKYLTGISWAPAGGLVNRMEKKKRVQY